MCKEIIVYCWLAGRDNFVCILKLKHFQLLHCHSFANHRRRCFCALRSNNVKYMCATIDSALKICATHRAVKWILQVFKFMTNTFFMFWINSHLPSRESRVAISPEITTIDCEILEMMFLLKIEKKKKRVTAAALSITARFSNDVDRFCAFILHKQLH